jgi:putative ATPase
MAIPLADRIRPKSLDEFVGQDHILGKDKPLRQLIERDQIPSIILWGPPGTGKTTLAYIIAEKTGYNFTSFSAVTSGVKELKEVIKDALNQKRYFNRGTILFVDELHHFNKTQQDAFLPYIEKGNIILIGATTENPSFELNSPLLSRCRVFTLKPLTEEEIKIIINRAIDIGFDGKVEIEPEAFNYIALSSYGDARVALNTLEMAYNSSIEDSYGKRRITLKLIEEVMQKKALIYDKKGEEHYNVISAFIKSMRGSNPDATLYWLARMLEAGEDPLFIARRMIIFASEDIGNADPNAIKIAVAAFQAFDFIGLPEGFIPLAHAAVYLATAPKSNASYIGYLKAREDVIKNGPLPVPLHIRNAPTRLMKDLGYGKGYKYPHDYPEIYQEYLPERLCGKVYYNPTDNGFESIIKKRLKELKEKRAKP